MIYKIKKGKHSAEGFHFRFYRRDSDVTVKGSFDKSCLYDSVSLDEERDINKLVGFSQGYFPKRKSGKWIPAHHWDSVRIGWRSSLEGDIELFLYTYQDGVRNARYICSVEAGEEWEINFTPVVYGSLLVSVKHLKDGLEKEDSITLSNFSGKGGYMLFPYFGGDYPAPHDVTINLVLK